MFGDFFSYFRMSYERGSVFLFLFCCVNPIFPVGEDLLEGYVVVGG